MKASNLLAIASVASLALGLIAAYTPGIGKLMIPRGPGSYITFPPQVLCYLLATVFCAAAFVESVSYIPLSLTMVQWHLWLSLGSFVIMCIGFGCFLEVSMAPPAGHENDMVTLLSFAGFLGVPIFLLAQAWFGIEMSRAVVKMIH